MGGKRGGEVVAKMGGKRGGEVKARAENRRICEVKGVYESWDWYIWSTLIKAFCLPIMSAFIDNAQAITASIPSTVYCTSGRCNSLNQLTTPPPAAWTLSQSSNPRDPSRR
jgi:hypothetical protein